MKTIIAPIMLLLLIAGCSMPRYGPAQAAPSNIDTSAIERQLTGTKETHPENTPVLVDNSTTKRYSIRAYQFAYDPNEISADYGDTVIITVTSVDVGHGFALPDFGINKRVPPEESATFQFVADRRGNFTFFNPVYSGSGWKDMKGTFSVR